MFWREVGGKGCAAESWWNRWWPGSRAHCHLCSCVQDHTDRSHYLIQPGSCTLLGLWQFPQVLWCSLLIQRTLKSEGSWVGGSICLCPILSSEAIAGLWKDLYCIGHQVTLGTASKRGSSLMWASSLSANEENLLPFRHSLLFLSVFTV